jgi:hypothetical protein
MTDPSFTPLRKTPRDIYDTLAHRTRDLDVTTELDTYLKVLVANHHDFPLKRLLWLLFQDQIWEFIWLNHSEKALSWIFLYQEETFHDILDKQRQGQDIESMDETLTKNLVLGTTLKGLITRRRFETA